MRILFSALPCILAIGGILLLKTYEIDEEKAAEITRDLERQRQKQGKCFGIFIGRVMCLKRKKMKSRM